MRIVSGKVIDGKIVVEGDPLDEGTIVTVVASDREESFGLSAEEEAALLAAIEQADSGDVVPAKELIERLRRHG